MKPAPSSHEPIAIIGSACRFAGGIHSPSQLWRLLKDPHDVQSTINDARFNAESFYHSKGTHHGHSNVIHSYLIDDDLSAFDAEFFGISPLEAKAMDPQHRLLMEVIFEALESSGHTIDQLRGSDTAVFAGMMTGDHEALQLRDLNAIPKYLAVGNSRAMLSSRIAYFFDWHGAAVTIDTACSSSLVAVHNAIQALRLGESRMAVACGSNLILGPESFIAESKLSMLSPSGRSRMWDDRADGYARGEGIAALILKPLHVAIADGDDIECIIRETGLNQDGATAGITLPSANAQRDLIRSTYARAGLDVSTNPPQYFEAHGTGTPAGDPIEAQAICDAFFPNKAPVMTLHQKKPLYVGSLKTVLGHTEGTAGIAAILKASLAIQNSVIPPNLHFDKLNPAIEPYYTRLEIRQTAVSWPEPEAGLPKRASVNSFGFGGTNAHAILEEYTKEQTPFLNPADRLPFMPYVFSASCKRTLRANLHAYAVYLSHHRDTSEHDLMYTLRKRGNNFSHRLTIPTMPTHHLEETIFSLLEQSHGDLGVQLPRKQGDSSKVLAIFTGQGAQGPRMAASMIEKSPLAAGIVQELEAHLSQLPAKDRPKWSLRTELLAEACNSRVSEAAIAQPLCTAIQILLVQLLRTTNVKINAVVGHSSGEIACAYAAGFLTARDALYIAYYRGLSCERSIGLDSKVKGAMLAVGTSMEDALDLCGMDEFIGRVNVAASNSASSVTLSGDKDAIEALEVVLQDEQKFCRRLKVDYAYHSNHMLPCFDPYVAALQQIGITPLTPPKSACHWYSSVYQGQVIDTSFALNDEYWAENMIKPVLFSQAVSAAAFGFGTFDLAVEFGPHPALRNPVAATLQNALQTSVPFVAPLHREKDSVETYSHAMGLIWSYLGSQSVDLAACEAAISGISARSKLIKSLPTYQWNHDKAYWHESRKSRFIRRRRKAFHSLLGHVSPDTAAHHLIWENVLRPSEIGWLNGHQVQGQIVFPAAGYISTALEAIRTVAHSASISFIELSNFSIHHPITFETDNTGVDIRVELSHLSHTQGGCDAKFTYSAGTNDEDSDLILAADGLVRFVYGDPSLTLFPERKVAPPHLIDVETNRLYNFTNSLGYHFTDQFRSLTKLQRTLGFARCKATRTIELDPESMLLHPVDLDAAFQTVMLAYGYPGDDRIRDLHLPTTVKKLKINPAVLMKTNAPKTEYSIDSTSRDTDPVDTSLGFSGDIELFITGCLHSGLQIDQAEFKPIKSATHLDRAVFWQTNWVPNTPDGASAALGISVSQNETDLLLTLSRIASYYMKQFDEIVPANSPVRSTAPLNHYLSYAHHATHLLQLGQHKHARSEWLKDSLDDIRAEVKRKHIENRADVKIMFLVGETMPQVFKGKGTMLESFRESGLLDLFYSEGFAMKQSALWLGNVAKQITDCYPRLRLLEVGAGTGSATRTILQAIGNDLHSYTFTDISTSFFANAARDLVSWKDKIQFQVLDVEKDPISQGFTEAAYDLVIASFVLHATTSIDNTLRNLRRLLKPGGYILISEGNSDGPLQSVDTFIFGSLPGWWLGVDEGRLHTPFIDITRWDNTLKRAGFSGIDTVSPQSFLDTLGVNLFVSQAVDKRISFLRHPLAHVSSISPKVAIICGLDGQARRYVPEFQQMFRDIGSEIVVFEDVGMLVQSNLTTSAAVLILSDLDDPVFQNITPQNWKSFKKVFEREGPMLWLTSGRLEGDVTSNMLVGFGRSATQELDDLRLQFLDIPDPNNLNVQMVVETLLRWCTTGKKSDQILCIPEPEIVVDERGRTLVPRVTQVSEANCRYNSVYHTATQQISPLDDVIGLQQHNDKYELVQLSRYETEELKHCPETFQIQLTHSLTSAIRTPTGYQYLGIGTDCQGTRFIAPLPSITSYVSLHQNSAIPINVPAGLEPVFLSLVSAKMMAQTLTHALFAGQKLLIHNAPEDLARVILNQAESKGIKVYFSSETALNPSAPTSWINLPPHITQSDLERLIPCNIVCFADLSENGSDIGNFIVSLLPKGLHCESLARLHSTESTGMSGILASATRAILLESVRDTLLGDFWSEHSIFPTVNVADLTDVQYSPTAIRVVEWKSQSALLTTRIRRLDSSRLFKTDKTYWLCGLSGGMGMSLCDWMIEKGVRFLVLSSRAPKIEPAWLEMSHRKGVQVEIMACDITDIEALNAVHQNIVETLPPIAGLVNGAMVLRDTSISNMTFDQLTDVLHPKVAGSLHLDQIFRDEPLDFFIMLSSINCVFGNAGQANYAAANMGMCGIAAKRRKRGLNATALNVGAIIGVGYITQSNRKLDSVVENMALMHLSDVDFHQMFAEAIESGFPTSTTGPELTTGLTQVTPDYPRIPKWYSNPKFQRLILHQTAGGDVNSHPSSSRSILERLQMCHDRQEVLYCIQDSLTTYLRNTLQLTKREDELLRLSSHELGFDSLISVDVRSWFIKNFHASIPVLRIMANKTSMSDLAALAAANIDLELVPNIEQSSDTSSFTGSGNDTQSEHSGSTETSIDITAHDPVTEFGSKDRETLSGDIDWFAESMPPEFALKTCQPRRQITESLTILLTGVTGLLGRHLLQSLLAQTSIGKVICIAVRRLTDRLEIDQVEGFSDRVIYYEGDLGAERFGLSGKIATAIFDEVDAVIHNGANTSHLAYYSKLKAVNVESTKQLLEYCVPRQIPIHYVSSAGVALFANQNPFPEISIFAPASGDISTEGDTLKAPPADGSQGYLASKWVNERLLEVSSARYDLNIWIYRPSTIIREGIDASTEAAQFDWVNALIHYCHQIKLVPMITQGYRKGNCGGFFDLVRVQSVCEDIVSALIGYQPQLTESTERENRLASSDVSKPECSRPGKITYINCVGDSLVPMNAGMGEFLGKENLERNPGSGRKQVYPMVPMKDWIENAVAAGLHPAVAALIETLNENSSQEWPMFLKQRRSSS